MGMDGHRFRQLADFRGGFVRQFGVEVGDHDFGLLLRKRFRRVLADTLPASRNYDNFVLQHELPPEIFATVPMQRIAQSRNGFNVAVPGASDRAWAKGRVDSSPPPREERTATETGP